MLLSKQTQLYTFSNLTAHLWRVCLHFNTARVGTSWGTSSRLLCWVPGLSMSHKQTPFYNHFPFHFLSEWPKPLWRVACNIDPAGFGHHLCPSFVERMFNWTAWRGHCGGALGWFSPDGATTSVLLHQSWRDENRSLLCITMLMTDCVQKPYKTHLGDFHGFNAAERLHDSRWVKQIFCLMRRWSDPIGQQKTLQTAVYLSC